MKSQTLPNLEKYISFDYQGYLTRYNVDIQKAQRYRAERALSSGAFLVKVSDLAYAIIEEKKWDTQVLGVKAYSLNNIFLQSEDERVLRRLIKSALYMFKNNGGDFLTFRFNGEKAKYIPLLEEAGFITTDILCTFLYSKDMKIVIDKNTTDLVHARETDWKAILEIARDSFKFSRMYADSHIPVKLADKFYLEITLALLKQKDSINLIYRSQKKISGFVIGTHAEDINKISLKKIGYLYLIAVAKSQRGKGCGENMVRRFLQELSQIVDYVEISTQINNIAAMNLYSSIGLWPVTHIVTMHYWRKS